MHIEHINLFHIWYIVPNMAKKINSPALPYSCIQWYSPKCVHLHLYALILTCTHSPSLVFTHLHLYSLTFTCTHSPSLVCTLLHLYALAVTCTHSPSLECTHLHLYSLNFTCIHSPSLVRTHLPSFKNFVYIWLFKTLNMGVNSLFLSLIRGQKKIKETLLFNYLLPTEINESL